MTVCNTDRVDPILEKKCRKDVHCGQPVAAQHPRLGGWKNVVSYEIRKTLPNGAQQISEKMRVKCRKLQPGEEGEGASGAPQAFLASTCPSLPRPS